MHSNHCLNSVYTANTCTNLCMCKCLYVRMDVQMNVCKYVCMYVYMYVCTCICVYLCLCPCSTVPGRQTVWRGGRVGLCMCVCLCVFLRVWSRCAWPPCAACCPSVLPSVCRLCPRSANSTTLRQEDPGERDAER